MVTIQRRKIRCFLLLLIIASLLTQTSGAQQVSEVITDFGGFWKSTTASQNPTFPNTSHNVLSFKYNSVIYSTGVNDTKLANNSVAYTPGDFRAFPVATVGGIVTNGASIYIALASQYDGIPNGYSNPLPSLKIKDVLIDGIHGLDLGTGATNIPASALVNFPISTITSSAIADPKPDILVSQIASPTSTGDTLYFVNSSGVVVGNKVAINWNLISKLGTYYLDLYTLPTGALCDTARISGTFDKETTREIRLTAYTLTDFGITTGNSATVTGFILKASGTSDPAFIAYNTDAFVIPAPVITVQPLTQIVCPNAANSVTFSVTATGGSLSYQWRKNNVDIPGAVNSAYIISNVISSSAGAYTVIVNNPVGSVASNTAYLNTSIAVQPSPSSQTIATGASCTLSISANNATAYQWKKAGLDISGATASSYTINPVTSVNAGDYTVQVINSANGGCTNIISSIVTIVPSTVLYSKPSVNLSLTESWGVATDGSGSSPADFSRAEHTFIVKNNAVTGGDFTIGGTLDLGNSVTTITSNTTLDARRIMRTGTGTLSGSASSNLTIRDTSNLYFQGGNDMLKYFTIYGGNIILNSSLSIAAGAVPGSVSIRGGTLNTSDNLTLKSDNTGTANIGTISGGGIIKGKVTTERYIPAARGWRLLSTPVAATGSPTINAAWQEGLTTASSNPNLYPGYGVKISGGTTANGFDQSSTNASFVKIYNNSTNSFTALPANPGTNIPINTYPAYFLYIRGDRSVDLMQGLNAAITSTTLRTKGNINTGNQAINVNASNYTLVGNPYPSAIDFETLTKNNVKNAFYVWDPKLSGNYGVGAYVTLIWNSATGAYDATSSVSPVSKYIPSGEAFFVTSADNMNPGTLTIKESDKTSNGSDAVFGRIAPVTIPTLNQQVRVNLYAVNTDASVSLLDAVLTTYHDHNTNALDNNDAKKLSGSSENIGIKREDKMLSIERRKTITVSDTSFLNIYQMKIAKYQLQVVVDNMNRNGMTAVIKDKYSNTINNIQLDMNGMTKVDFSINSDPASYAKDRFSIVFLPHTRNQLATEVHKAYRLQNDIAVEWKTENVPNTSTYEVERSADGKVFSSINATVSKGETAAYKVLDVNPLNSDNYYRIRTIDKDNKATYSEVLKVNKQDEKLVPSIVVYPNPVTGNTITMQVNNMEQGNYNLQLYNAAGQLIASKAIQHTGNSAAESLDVNTGFTAGKYELKLTGDSVKIATGVIKN